MAQENLNLEAGIAERAAHDPDLYEAIYGVRPDLPFSITLEFSNLDAPDFPKALDLARQSADFLQTGGGASARYRARFFVGDAARLLDVFNVVSRSADLEVLVDDQAVPYGRELWIPLVSFFVNP